MDVKQNEETLKQKADERVLKMGAIQIIKNLLVGLNGTPAEKYGAILDARRFVKLKK